MSEFIKSGIRINPEDTEGTALRAVEILNDKNLWQEISEAQRAEIADYQDRGYEQILSRLWQSIANQAN